MARGHNQLVHIARNATARILYFRSNAPMTVPDAPRHTTHFWWYDLTAHAYGYTHLDAMNALAWGQH